MRYLKSTALVLLASTISVSSLAQEHRQHGAHEHGIGRLNLAQDGADIHIELESPAANIVGFEHAPSTDADREALAKAIARLRAGDRLFRFSEEAACRLTLSRVDTPLINNDGSKLHDGHESQGETHADITAEYRFTCARPGKLKHVDVTLFQAFPATEHLEVQIVTGSRQSRARLTASSPVLKF